MTQETVEHFQIVFKKEQMPKVSPLNGSEVIRETEICFSLIEKNKR